MISVLRGDACLLPRLGPFRVHFVQIGMMSIVSESVKVSTGRSSTSVLESLCRGAMDLEVTHGLPDVGIAPRKGLKGCAVFFRLSPVRVEIATTVMSCSLRLGWTR